MKTRRILGLVAGTALLVAGAAGQEAAAPSPRKAARVEQEYGLARTPSTYFIFDFEAGKVSLKARGLVLKEWPIFKVKTWGRHGGGEEGEGQMDGLEADVGVAGCLAQTTPGAR